MCAYQRTYHGHVPSCESVYGAQACPYARSTLKTAQNSGPCDETKKPARLYLFSHAGSIDYRCCYLPTEYLPKAYTPYESLCELMRAFPPFASEPYVPDDIPGNYNHELLRSERFGLPIHLQEMPFQHPEHAADVHASRDGVA